MRVRVDLDPKNVLKVDGRRRKSRKCRMSKNDFLGMSKWLLWSQIRLTPWCRVSSFQPVLRLLVSPQIHLSLETFAAEVAAERFVSGVFPAVRNEVGALAERLPAHLAFVWLFTWKRKKNKNTFDLGFKKIYIIKINERYTFCCLKIGFCAQIFYLGYRTIKTTNVVSSLSSLTCVDEGVFLHVRLLMEPFAAVLAWVRPRVGVDKQVSRQSWRPLETFTAYFAVETSFLKREQRPVLVKFSSQRIHAWQEGGLKVRCESKKRKGCKLHLVVWGVKIPESARPCVVPGSLRVRKFCRRFRTQMAGCRCVICGRALLNRGEWKTPENNNELTIRTF